MSCSQLRQKTRKSQFLVALKQGKFLAPLTFEGSCNKDLFEFWLKYCLLPVLEPRDIIIDNASFHKGESITGSAKEVMRHCNDE